jgi:hypothetical protein
LSNGIIEITHLLGGGHIADFRLRDSPLNVLWESPWQTIDPHTYSPAEHGSIYGEGPVGKFLSGYTGHALVLGYFGMPSDAQAAQGLPLHGEAASSEWNVVATEQNEEYAALTLEVALPAYHLDFRRETIVTSKASTATVRETVRSRSAVKVEFQWVQHVAFGEPFLTKQDSTLFLPVSRARTWPLGYEGHGLLRNDADFSWPYAPGSSGGLLDLSTAFEKDGTGFVASLLTLPERAQSYMAVHNRRHALVAGYCFDRSQFPWIALWEENCARKYAPWNGISRVRGMEFGTSPMPLGIDQAREVQTLFDTPALTSLAPNSRLTTVYDIFIRRVPSSWKCISDIVQSASALTIREGLDHEASVKTSHDYS